MCYWSPILLGVPDEAMKMKLFVILSTTFLPRLKKKSIDLIDFHALKLGYRVFADKKKVNATTVLMCVPPVLPPFSLVIFESFGYH